MCGGDTKKRGTGKSGGTEEEIFKKSRLIDTG